MTTDAEYEDRLVQAMLKAIAETTIDVTTETGLIKRGEVSTRPCGSSQALSSRPMRPPRRLRHRNWSPT